MEHLPLPMRRRNHWYQQKVLPSMTQLTPDMPTWISKKGKFNGTCATLARYFIRKGTECASCRLQKIAEVKNYGDAEFRLDRRTVWLCVFADDRTACFRVRNWDQGLRIVEEVASMLGLDPNSLSCVRWVRLTVRWMRTAILLGRTTLGSHWHVWHTGLCARYKDGSEVKLEHVQIHFFPLLLGPLTRVKTVIPVICVWRGCRFWSPLEDRLPNWRFS
jgi:hypothetical protein